MSTLEIICSICLTPTLLTFVSTQSLGPLISSAAWHLFAVEHRSYPNHQRAILPTTKESLCLAPQVKDLNCSPCWV